MINLEKELYECFKECIEAFGSDGKIKFFGLRFKKTEKAAGTIKLPSGRKALVSIVVDTEPDEDMDAYDHLPEFTESLRRKAIEEIQELGEEMETQNETPKYPEHVKLDKEKLKIINDFHNFLEENDMAIYRVKDFSASNWNKFICTVPWNFVRASFFGADEIILEKERIQMLNELQNA